MGELDIVGSTFESDEDLNTGTFIYSELLYKFNISGNSIFKNNTSGSNITDISLGLVKDMNI